MDFEKLIKAAVDNNAEKIEVDLLPFEYIWEKARRHKRVFPKNRFSLVGFSIAEWVEVAVILLMLIMLPLVVTNLRNSSFSKIASSIMQEAVLTNTDIENAKKEASDFLTGLNTFADYNTFEEKVNMLYPYDYRTKKLQSYLSDKYYSDFIANREALLIPSTAFKLKSKVKLDGLTIDKYSTDTKIKQVVFYFEAITSFIKDADSKETMVKTDGKIKMDFENGTWKVSEYFPQSVEPKNWFKNK